ncbi:acyl carrier protein [Albimonas pacifica]|uniref:Acyl carrier protein n=1 Tax=Albimonas pacifica TaxID=1114924 RepID=A0A1I3CJ40_9RHOB|nr:acyl carrier protein [Albimonas pacifica]SFH74600.1 acyl carrier protein [Albimonas pacifica]
MTRADTEQLIRDLISENVDGFDGHQLKADARFIDAGMDSLDLATVLLEVQEATGVTFPDGEEEKYDSLTKLLDYIEKAQSE